MPEPAPAFIDAVFGPTEGSSAGDFIVMRADGFYAYQLAVVVDDLAMRITEVVRGEDLRASTSRQIAIAHALGASAPMYMHVPLVLGPDGERLSKRHASTAIAELRDQGQSAEQIVGRLAATLGLVDDTTRVSPRQLVEGFDLSKIPHTATRLSPV